MTIKIQLLIGLPLLAIAFPVGYMLALYTHKVEVPSETLYERVMETPKEPEKPAEVKTTEEPAPLPKYYLWTYYFPDYETGKAVGIKAPALEDARREAIEQELGQDEVLSTWRKQ